MSDLSEAGRRHADGLTAKLSLPDWRPGRSHIEQARNSIAKLVDEIEHVLGANDELDRRLQEVEAQRDALNGDVHQMGQEIERLREQLVKKNAALKQIAEHPEKKTGTRVDESSYGVGWAFWNVQHIARAALSDEQQKQPCVHHSIISLDGKWHCQKCGEAIEMATALKTAQRDEH